MLGWRLEVAALSDIGQVRSGNEDTAGADPERGIVLVADGMGGHRAGEVASRMAHDIALAGLRANGAVRLKQPAQVVHQVFRQANRSILDAANGNAAYRGMGTTLALVLFHDRRATLAHVGDSRIYRLRAGRLSLLTRDDSLLSDQVELGLISADEAGASHNRHLVTQALGIREQISPSLREEEVQAGDLFLLCSDGLHNMVEDADIELIMSSLAMNLPLAARHLVQLANDNGGYDNVSVVLVKAAATAPAASRGGWLGRLLRWMR